MQLKGQKPPLKTLEAPAAELKERQRLQMRLHHLKAMKKKRWPGRLENERVDELLDLLQREYAS